MVELSPNDIIETGTYRVIRRLGAGGMGQAWLVEHTRLSKYRVLKFITAGTYERFEREAKLGAKLADDPHFVTIHDYRNNLTLGPYIDMEFIDGISLENYRPNDLVSTVDIISQIAEALYIMHSHNIVHRDIKPSNIFLKRDESALSDAMPRYIVKVGDFGLVRPLQDPEMTQDGSFLGTVQWASPEQMESASEVDSRSDLYSLGLLCYRLLTGFEFPQHFAPALQVLEDGRRKNNNIIYNQGIAQLHQAKQTLPPAPGEINQFWGIPPQLDELTLKLLEPDKNKRYQTAREVVLALAPIRISLQESFTASSAQPIDITPATSPAPSVLSAGGMTQAMLPSNRHIDIQDLMKARTAQKVFDLFRKLGYAVPQTLKDAEMSINAYEGWTKEDADNIENGYLIASYSTLQIFLLEMKDITPQALQRLANNLVLHAGGFYLFIAVQAEQKSKYNQLAMVCPQLQNKKTGTKQSVKLNRLVIYPDHPSRYQLDVLENIALPPEEVLSGQAIHKHILSAFSVEELTKDFYEDYAKCFRKIADEVTRQHAENPGLLGKKSSLEQEINGFAQRLLGRIMFLYFLQKKGWLVNDPNFLSNQYRLHHKLRKNFYQDFLVPLFFENLTCRQEERPSKNSLEYPVWDEKDVPYLNGGLFELSIGQEYERELKLPDQLFSPDDAHGLLRIFNSYDFTIEEDTPLDVAVALDPEMLGKVFERLVTGRHETGSYYTPKDVVTFMCREALKKYLSTYLSATPKEREELSTFVDERKAEHLSKAEDVFEALKTVRVCDLACGSGAYLVGMLHELLELRTILFVNQDSLAEQDIYERKLTIIRENLYGVDADPMAVDIARLRLWLSLIVDFNGDHPLPLPSLDYKIMVGDSLLETIQGQTIVSGRSVAQPGMLQFALSPDFVLSAEDERLALQEKFVRLRDEWHEREDSLSFDEKRKLQGELFTTERELMLLELSKQEEIIQEKEQDLQDAILASQGSRRKYALEKEYSKIHAQLSAIVEMQRQVSEEKRRPLFSFHRYFFEVFKPTNGTQGGFHIILANPPYVRADAPFNHLHDDEEARQRAISNWKHYRAAVMGSGLYHTLHEKWDLYIAFLERAFQLLRPKGYMVFIISDAYNAAKYATKSHDFFLEHAAIERIDFCSDLPLFEVGVRNTIVHISKSKAPENFVPERKKHIGTAADDFDQHVKLLEQQTQKKLGQALFRPDGNSITMSGLSNTLKLGNICYISKGAVVHANERSHPGAFKLEDLVSSTKDAIHTRQFVVGRDISRWNINNIRYLEWGTERAPSQFSRPTFTELHTAKERLLSRRISFDEVMVAYDDQQIYANHQVTIFVPWHHLKGVKNKSIRKTAKYQSETKPNLVEVAVPREMLEEHSLDFLPKYLLAVMNSSFAKQFLQGIRQSTRDIYPDEWKKLPVPRIPLTQQLSIVGIVDSILREFELHEPTFDNEASKRVLNFEQELDERIEELYTNSPEEMLQQERLSNETAMQDDDVVLE